MLRAKPAPSGLSREYAAHWIRINIWGRLERSLQPQIPTKTGSPGARWDFHHAQKRKKNQGRKEENSEEGIKSKKCLMTSSGTLSISKQIHQQFLGCAGEGSRGWEQGCHLQCGEMHKNFLPKLFLDGKLDSWLNQIDFRKFLIPVGIRNHIFNWNFEAGKKGELWWKVSSKKWASVCSDFPPDPILLQLLNISPVKPYFDGELNIFPKLLLFFFPKFFLCKLLNFSQNHFR